MLDQNGKYVMNEAEAELVAALRSGKYEQAKGRLRCGNSYCCLGVACDILIPDVVWYTAPETKDLPAIQDAFGVLFNGGFREDYDLPPSVQKRLGWATDAGQLRMGARMRDGNSPPYLTGLNDEGFTFNQIADLIEHGLIEREEDR